MHLRRVLTTINYKFQLPNSLEWHYYILYQKYLAGTILYAKCASVSSASVSNKCRLQIR